MKYILIIVMVWSSGATSTAEFNSKETCAAAAAQTNTYMATENAKAICYPK